MHFEITASLQSLHKPLTTAQRNSSLFSEAPRLAGKTLRRGQVMRMSEAEFKTNEVMAKRLFDAGAIEITMVDGDRREDFRTREKLFKQNLSSKEVSPKEPPPPPPPPPPPEITVQVAVVGDAHVDARCGAAWPGHRARRGVGARSRRTCPWRSHWAGRCARCRRAWSRSRPARSARRSPA